MSRLKVKGRPPADKRNVLSVFANHYKSQVSTEVPISNATACCSSCSHADGSGTLHGNAPVKEKRLKTRKERDHRRQKCGGQNIKSHCNSKQSCKEKELCHGQAHSHNREKFAKAFGSKEPSFITERRLIGHQGLFNHEVKSFDIERLLSEERRVERAKKQGNDTNKTTFSPTHNSGDDKCSPNRKDDVSRTRSNQGVLFETACDDMVKSQTLQSDDSSANNQGLGPSLMQRKTEGMDFSPSESNSVIVLSSSPKSPVSNKMPELTPRNSVEEFNTSQVDSAECPIQPVTCNTITQHPECTPAILKPPAPYPKMQKPSSPPDSPAAKDKSSASLDQKEKSGKVRPQTEAKVARHLISIVADRLCQSLDRPFLLRHHLLEESRANILHVLQERHGTLLQQNLLKLHSALGLEQRELDSRHTCSADIHGVTSEDNWTAAIKNVQSSGSTPDCVQQSWPGTQPQSNNKRRRKQKRPKRRTTPSPPSSHGLLNDSLQDTDPGKLQGLPWTLNMGTEQEVLMEPGNPTSDPFSLGHQTTDSFLTDSNIFSKWGSHPGLPPKWDKLHRRDEIRARHISSSYENWRHDPDLDFTCHTGYQGQHKNPFSSYSMVPQDGDLREPQCLSVDQQFDFDRHQVSACSPDTRQSSLRNFQLQPYYRFQHPLPPASSSMSSYRTDMNFYPPSELLDMALSPPKRPSASPEGWSYPRMRLY